MIWISPLKACPLVLFTTLALCLGACGSRVFHAKGTLAGQSIDTTVDSRLAQYLVQTYDTPSGAHRNAAFDALIDAALHEAENGASRAWLRQLSGRHSIDFATLIYARTINGRPRNHKLQERHQSHLRRLERARPDAVNLPYVVLFAPGWFYAAHPQNGGDYASSRAQLTALGIDNRLARFPENGSVESNAEYIVAAVRRIAAQGQKVVLVSASKSGPEVALALGGHHDIAKHVLGWVNIGGVLRGSPLADRPVDSPTCGAVVKTVLWARGFDMEGVLSLGTKRSRKRYKTLRFPDHISIINYVPWPVSGDIGKRAQGTYSKLRAHGPNDGLTLLADGMVTHGHTLIATGLDHFLKAEDLERRTLALVLTLNQLIDSRRAKGYTMAQHSHSHGNNGPNHPGGPHHKAR